MQLFLSKTFLEKYAIIGLGRPCGYETLPAYICVKIITAAYHKSDWLKVNILFNCGWLDHVEEI